MQPLHRDINPFALMIDPQAILAQIERSERLERLQRRVCRPLDKPLLPDAAAAGGEQAAFDAAVDKAAEDRAGRADNHRAARPARLDAANGGA